MLVQTNKVASCYLWVIKMNLEFLVIVFIVAAIAGTAILKVIRNIKKITSTPKGTLPDCSGGCSSCSYSKGSKCEEKL